MKRFLAALVITTLILVFFIPAAQATIIIFDDGGSAFWATGGATESDDTEEYQSGSNSYALNLTNGVSFNMIHQYGSGQDWSAETSISFWIYGAGDGDGDYLWLRVERLPDWDDYYYTVIYMNFSGWQQFEIDFDDFLENGSPQSRANVFGSVRHIEFLSWYSGSYQIIRFDGISGEGAAAAGAGETVSTAFTAAALAIAIMYSIVLIFLIVKLMDDQNTDAFWKNALGMLVFAIVLLVLAGVATGF